MGNEEGYLLSLAHWDGLEAVKRSLLGRAERLDVEITIVELRPACLGFDVANMGPVLVVHLEAVHVGGEHPNVKAGNAQIGLGHHIKHYAAVFVETIERTVDLPFPIGIFPRRSAVVKLDLEGHLLSRLANVVDSNASVLKHIGRSHVGRVGEGAAEGVGRIGRRRELVHEVAVEHVESIALVLALLHLELAIGLDDADHIAVAIVGISRLAGIALVLVALLLLGINAPDEDTCLGDGTLEAGRPLVLEEEVLIDPAI